MKTKAITLLIVLASFQAIGGTVSTKVDTCASTKAPVKFGYLVVVDNGTRFTKIKTESMIEVYTIAEMVFPGNCIDFNNELTKSTFFEMYSENRGIYVEKKVIRNNGKLKRIRK